MKTKDKILFILLPFLLFAAYFWLFYYIIGKKKNLIVDILLAIFLVAVHMRSVFKSIKQNSFEDK